MYPTSRLSPTYRRILWLTSGRGEHTLARLDAKLIKLKRQITFGSEAAIIVPPDPHFFRYLIQSHESHVSNALQRICKAGSTVLDIGANIGYFVACAADIVGKRGTVIGFEPESQNFKYLDINCQALRSYGFKCRAYQYAISSEIGNASLNIHKYSTYHSIGKSCQFDKVGNCQIVETITLDEWTEINGVEHIHCLKVDTEGHEKDVLTGARELFSKGAIDNSILECRSDELSAFIDEFAKEFNLHQLVWDGQKWHQSALSSFDYKTECLLSKETISPQSLL